MTNNANYNKQIMAEHIKEKLNQNGMTAKEFSEKLGFKYTTVLDWIHAKTYPRIDKIEKMANFFGVDKADLIEPHRDPKEDDEKLLTSLMMTPSSPSRASLSLSRTWNT